MSRKQSNTELDRLRLGRSEIENHYIDELVSGQLDRRTFLRRGSMIGMSVPLMGAVLAACGSSSSSSASSSASSSSSAGTPKKGGTLRIAVSTPAAAVNPLTVSDAGGLCMLGQTGEFLIFDSNLKLALQPMLATKWSPNSDGSVWTFTLRSGVTFNTGAAMTADDVVYTFQQLSDPKNASNALSVFTGVLSPSGVKAVNPTTVEFTLQSAERNFPYLVSSDNYNAIIVPKGTDYSKWQSTFPGTGAFKLSSYTESVGANFVANPSYWGGKPYLDGTQFKFFSSQQPQILALEGNEVDVIAQFVPAGATSSLTTPRTRSSSSRLPITASCRCATTSPRSRTRACGRRSPTRSTVRRWSAPCSTTSARSPTTTRSARGSRQRHLDPAAHTGPREGKATAVGRRAPERLQHHAQDRDLRGGPAAGPGDQGICRESRDQHQPDDREPVRVLRQGDVRQLRLARRNDEPGRLRRPRRPERVPDGAADVSGPWNAARFHNTQYDKLVAQYVAALDLSTQRSIAGQIQTLLLNETPIIYPYWIDGLTASIPTVGGLNPTSIAQLYLNNAYMS